MRDLAGIDDEDLARDAQAGCIASFEELARRYQVPLLRFLWRRSRHLHDAEDAVQESLVKAYQSLHLYRKTWPFKTWLFTLSYRVAVSLGRKRKIGIRSDPPETAAPGESPFERAAREDSGRELWETAHRVLSEGQFTALWLYYVESMPAGDIAVVLGRSWAWVKTALHRARQKLQVELTQPEEATHHRIALSRGQR